MTPPSTTAAQTPANEASVSGAPVIVMLGDSLTAGYNLPSGSALPAAIQRRFDASDVTAKLVNAGVSGATTADGLAAYDWSVSGSGADLLVVALGANDFLNGLPAAEPRRNLAAIIERAQADKLPVALVGVAIPQTGVSDPREADYARIYQELAATYGLPLYPDMLGAVAGDPALLLDDGVHPTAEGVEAMSAAIADFLAPLVPADL